MSREIWLLYVTTVIGLLITPGNMTLLALSHGIRFGALKSIGTALGSVSAGLIVMTASMLGLSTIIATSEIAFQGIKWLGATYLVYLGISSWRAKPEKLELKQNNGFENKSARKLYMQSLLIGLGNPKGIIFFAAFFPQFINVSLPQFPQFVILCLTFMTFDFMIMMLYASGAHQIARFIQSPERRKIFNRVTGSIFVFSATLLALTNQ